MDRKVRDDKIGNVMCKNKLFNLNSLNLPQNSTNVIPVIRNDNANIVRITDSPYEYCYYKIPTLEISTPLVFCE
jgi:hypothetical protein